MKQTINLEEMSEIELIEQKREVDTALFEKRKTQKIKVLKQEVEKIKNFLTLEIEEIKNSTFSGSVEDMFNNDCKDNTNDEIKFDYTHR